MKIVMVGPFGLRPKGTMAVRALPIAKALAARGHPVSLLLPPWSWPQDAGRSWMEAGVQVINIALPPRIPVLFHVLITLRLLRQALAVRPDVVHCFKPKAYAGLVAAVVWILQRLRLTRVRLVVDTDDWEGAGGWNEIENYTPLQKRFFAWQETWGLTHCDAVTVASRELEWRVSAMRTPPSAIYYVPNGSEVIHPKPVFSKKTGCSTDSRHGPTLLLYTRFFEFRVERLLDLFGRIVTEIPEAKLLIVGEGLFGEERELLRQARANGLIRQISLVGWVRPEELPAYFAAADLAIFPIDDTLLNRARCPVKLVDLLTAGVPVVAERVGQIPEYIEHARSGWLVPPGDRAAFVAGVVEVVRDPVLRARLGLAARERMTHEFAWSRLTQVVERAYDGV